jgi:hypothetical protein
VGVIDAIADGFFAVAKRPLVLFPVVALDLLFWGGGRLTVAPLTNSLVTLLEGARDQVPAGTDLDSTIDSLRVVEQGSDLLKLLALGQKPLLPRLDTAQVAHPWGVGVFDMGNAPLTILVALLLLLAGLFWLAVALTLVAPLARGEPLAPRQLLRQVPRCWFALLGFGAILVGAAALLFLPLVVLAAVIEALGLSAAPLAFLVIVPLLLLYVCLALTPEAIAVRQVGPLRAIKLSVLVVRHNFWRTVGLLAAIFLVDQGFPLILGLLAQQTAGVPLAIVGNAFISTALLAAGMFFFRERLLALEEGSTNEQQRPQARRSQP